MLERFAASKPEASIRSATFAAQVSSTVSMHLFVTIYVFTTSCRGYVVAGSAPAISGTTLRDPEINTKERASSTQGSRASPRDKSKMANVFEFENRPCMLSVVAIRCVQVS